MIGFIFSCHLYYFWFLLFFSASLIMCWFDVCPFITKHSTHESVTWDTFSGPEIDDKLYLWSICQHFYFMCLWAKRKFIDLRLVSYKLQMYWHQIIFWMSVCVCDVIRDCERCVERNKNLEKLFEIVLLGSNWHRNTHIYRRTSVT